MSKLISSILQCVFSGIGVYIIGIIYNKYKEKKEIRKIENTIKIVDENNVEIETKQKIGSYNSNKAKIVDYREWIRKKHPEASNNENWIPFIIFGVIFGILPGIIIATIWMWYLRKWRNEYCIYAIEESLRVYDIINASDYAFKITKTGIPIEQYASLVYATMLECKRCNDEIRFQQLNIKLRREI